MLSPSRINLFSPVLQSRSVPFRGGIPAWVRGDTGFDFQFERGFYDGVRYSSFDAWWTAVGGVYTRSGTKRYIDSDRLLKVASANVWPDEYDPQTGAKIGKSVWAPTTIDSRWSRDLTNAVWSATNATVAKDQVGLDGVANAASRVTATANAATVTQAVSDATSRNRGLALFIKRLSGTGSIEINAGDGVWVDVTEWVTTGYFGRVSTFCTSVSNPTFGIRLGTSGDAIAVDYAQLSRSAMAGPPILAEGTAETFAGDVPYIPTAGLADWSPSDGAIMVRARRGQVRTSGGGDNGWTFAISDGTTSNVLLDNLGTPNGFSASVSGVSQVSMTGALQSPTYNMDHERETLRWAGRWKLNDYRACVEGFLTSADTSATLATVSRIYLGARGAGTNQFGGWLQEVWIRGAGVTDTDLMRFGSSLRPLVTFGDSLSIGTAATLRRLNYMRVAGRASVADPFRTTIPFGAGGSKIADAISQQAAAASIYSDCTQLFWTGTNDSGIGSATAANVIPGYQTLIAAVPHSRWLFFTVLEVVADNATQITQKREWNAWLRANVPNNLVDIMAVLLLNGDGSPTDNAAIADGRVPPSLLGDSIHLNNRAAAIAGGQLIAFLESKGW